MKAILTTTVLIIAVLTGVVAGVLIQQRLPELGLSRRGPSDETGANSEATGPPVVTALGTLEPESGIVQVSAPAGSRIERLAEQVHDGAYVEKDQPLAYLDTYPELAAARNLAQIQLDEARKRLQAETAYNQAAIAVAKLKIRQADDVIPKQIKAQEAEVRRSLAELEKARIDMRRSASMLEDKAIPQSVHDGVALLVRQCEEQWERNKATLEHLTTDREIKLLTARAELESAESGLVRAQLAQLVDSLSSAVQMAEVKLDRSVIKAPLDGEIMKVLTRAGETVGHEPLLKMGGTKVMVAVAEVYETELRFVRPGQKAVITSRAFPDQRLSGIVERIGSLVRKNDVLHLDPAKDADARVIEVRIRLDDAQVAARYNQMQVDVTIDRAP
jgi:HlyD family secretion protein